MRFGRLVLPIALLLPGLATAQLSDRLAGDGVVIGGDDRAASAVPACAFDAGRTVQVFAPVGGAWRTGSASLVRIPGGAGQTVFLTAASTLYDVAGDRSRLLAPRGELRVGLETAQGATCRFGGMRVAWTRLIRAGWLEGALAVFRVEDHDAVMRGAAAPGLAEPGQCSGQAVALSSIQQGVVRDRAIRQACRIVAMPGDPAGRGMLIGHDCDAGQGAVGGALSCRAGADLAAVGVHAGGTTSGALNVAVKLTPAIIAEIAAITPP
ncbi:MAG: hypothetical protein AAF899_09210 [Pseudomonadota bacterium]